MRQSMSDVHIEIVEMFHAGLSRDECMKRTGYPAEWIDAIFEQESYDDSGRWEYEMGERDD